MTNRRFGLVFAFFLLAMFALTSNVSAQAEAPTTIGNAYFAPSTILSGDSTTLNVDTLKAATDTLVVGLCFYYSDTGLDTLFPETVIGSRGTIYTRTYQGVDRLAIDCPAFSGGQVSEYSGKPTALVKLFGENFDLTAALSMKAGDYTVDILELEDAVYTDGFSAPLTVQAAPPPVTEAYVSNTSTCGGNSPCYTGNSGLQQALADVEDGGTIFIYGTYSQGGGVTAVLSGSKSVTISGFNSPVIENGGSTCAGAMIDNQSSGVLTFSTVTLDGTCAVGSRSAGILQSGAGTAVVQDSFSTIRDFTAAGSAALRVTNGTLIASGNGFQNNQKAFDQTGGTLYAFANNVSTNLGSNAATKSGGISNISCNYWSASTISGFAPEEFVERLGAPVVSYNEGAGSLTLDAASLASNGGTQVIVSMGRANNPYGNGTVIGLGARVSDYYAACGTRTSALSGLITIAGDSVSPGPTGFRLYAITDPLQCSPASNTQCWDYEGVSCGAAGCAITGAVARDGHFMVGNEVDPTSISLASFGSQAESPVWLPLVFLGIALGAASLVVLRRRQA